MLSNKARGGNGRIAISKSGTLPNVLTYTDIRSYAFIAVFVSLAVATPWVFHQFYLAGPVSLFD